jgi:hypothetical protein
VNLIGNRLRIFSVGGGVAAHITPAGGPTYPPGVGPFGVVSLFFCCHQGFMSITDHLSELQCPHCKVQLLRALDLVAGPIVFCSECLAGGRYKEGMQQRGALTASFVTPQG